MIILLFSQYTIALVNCFQHLSRFPLLIVSFLSTAYALPFFQQLQFLHHCRMLMNVYITSNQLLSHSVQEILSYFFPFFLEAVSPALSKSSTVSAFLATFLRGTGPLEGVPAASADSFCAFFAATLACRAAASLALRDSGSPVCVW